MSDDYIPQHKNRLYNEIKIYLVDKLIKLRKSYLLQYQDCFKRNPFAAADDPVDDIKYNALLRSQAIIQTLQEDIIEICRYNLQITPNNAVLPFYCN